MKNRVKQLRERKGISQIDLAERLGVSRQALSAVETEKQSPSLQTAMKVARELDTPLAQIFSLEDESMQSILSTEI